jgi:hypothetical protein
MPEFVGKRFASSGAACSENSRDAEPSFSARPNAGGVRLRTYPRSTVSREPFNPASLPPDVAQWVREHHGVLDAIYQWFDTSGEWPDPVELQRRLRAGGDRIRLASVLRDMPPLIGFRTTSPNGVRLSLIGIACCAASNDLLQKYFDAFRSRSIGTIVRSSRIG